MMRREILGVVLSLTALLTAAAVGAQESDGSDTDQAAPASDAQVQAWVSGGPQLMVKINSMYEKAKQEYQEAKGNTSRLSCTGEIVKAMSGPYRLAAASAAGLEQLSKGERTEAATSDIEREYIKLSSHYETMVTLFSKLSGCGNNEGGSIIDGAPLVEKTTPTNTAQTDPSSGNSGATNLGDITTGAENTKQASPTALGETAQPNP